MITLVQWIYNIHCLITLALSRESITTSRCSVFSIHRNVALLFLDSYWLCEDRKIGSGDDSLARFSSKVCLGDIECWTGWIVNNLFQKPKTMMTLVVLILLMSFINEMLNIWFFIINCIFLCLYAYKPYLSHSHVRNCETRTKDLHSRLQVYESGKYWI